MHSILMVSPSHFISAFCGFRVASILLISVVIRTHEKAHATNSSRLCGQVEARRRPVGKEGSCWYRGSLLSASYYHTDSYVCTPMPALSVFQWHIHELWALAAFYSILLYKCDSLHPQETSQFKVISSTRQTQTIALQSTILFSSYLSQFFNQNHTLQYLILCLKVYCQRFA